MNKFYSILCLLLLIPGWCVAADEKEPTLIADSWTMVPKAGHEDQFETALKEHLAMRSEKGDSRQWMTYTPVTGSDLNHYVVRSCCNYHFLINHKVHKVFHKGHKVDHSILNTRA